jgi:hypothetical protein
MKPIKQLAWRRRAAMRAPKIVMGDPVAFRAMLNNWIAEAEDLERLHRAAIQPLELDRRLDVDKDDLLAAEISWPLDPACDLSNVRSVRVRRPYAVDVETVLVDVSRLPAP